MPAPSHAFPSRRDLPDGELAKHLNKHASKTHIDPGTAQYLRLAAYRLTTPKD